MKEWKRWLPGAIVSVVFIGVFLYFVDFGEMMEAIRNANYAFLGIAFILGFVWIGLRAQAWRVLLREQASYSAVFWTVGEGYFLNNFLPFRLGEIGRAFLLSRKSDLKFLEILPTIVIERVVDLGFTAMVLLASLPFVVGADGAERAGVIVGVVVLFGLILLYILARSNKWALDIFHKLSSRWPVLQRVGGSFLEAFFAGLSVLTDGWLFLRFMFWMALNYGLAIVSYYFIIRAFFPEATVVWAMFGLGAAALGNAIPALPGGVGTLEGAFGGALIILTGNESISFATALSVRLYNYVNSMVIGGIGLAREGQTLSSVYQELMNLRNKENDD